MTDRAEVYREYVLVTGGRDSELDAIGVIIECTKDLDIDAKKRDRELPVAAVFADSTLSELEKHE